MSGDGMPTRADGAYIKKPDPRADTTERAEPWDEPEVDPIEARLDALEQFAAAIADQYPELHTAYIVAFGQASAAREGLI